MGNKFIRIGNCLIAIDDIMTISKSTIMDNTICIEVLLKNKNPFTITGPDIDNTYFEKIVKKLCTL